MTSSKNDHLTVLLTPQESNHTIILPYSQSRDGIEAQERSFGKVLPVDENLTGVRGKSREEDRSKCGFRAGYARIIVEGPFSALPAKSRSATRV